MELFIGLLLGVLLAGVPAAIMYSAEKNNNPERVTENQFTVPIEPVSDAHKDAENEIARIVTEDIVDSYLRVEPEDVVVDDVSITSDGWVAKFRTQGEQREE